MCHACAVRATWRRATWPAAVSSASVHERGVPLRARGRVAQSLHAGPAGHACPTPTVRAERAGVTPDPGHPPPSGSGRLAPEQGRYVRQNASLSAVAWVVSTAAAFFCLPIYVRGLGPDAYGLLVLVSALTGLRRA